jgi:hypothetical protein
MAQPVAQEGSVRAGAGSGCYVYGIVETGTTLPGDLPAVGGATRVELVAHGRLAALVSGVGSDRALGTRADLLSHEQVLDTVAAGSTVLPMRFGAVLADRAAVVEELGRRWSGRVRLRLLGPLAPYDFLPEE